MMEALYLYPWAAPLFVGIAILSLIGTYISFKQEKYLLMMSMGITQTLISTFLVTGAAPVLFGVGLTQIYLGVVNVKRVKAVRHE